MICCRSSSLNHSAAFLIVREMLQDSVDAWSALDSGYVQSVSSRDLCRDRIQTVLSPFPSPVACNCTPLCPAHMDHLCNPCTRVGHRSIVGRSSLLGRDPILHKILCLELGILVEDLQDMSQES